MNAVSSLLPPVKSSIDLAVNLAIDAACRLIAPTWPLDRFIAVNPYWGWVDRPIEKAAAQLEQLGGSRMYMPQAFYRNAWNTQAFQSGHLAQAMAEAGVPVNPTEVIATLDGAQATSIALPLLSDLLDAQRQLAREPAWRSTITHQISQFCAAYFDAEQADWHPAQSLGLYDGWRHSIAHDHGISLLMKAPDVLQRSQALPADARQAITFVLDKLGVSADGLSDFLCAVLHRINGWASWCAYLRWQARLEGGDDTQIVELLAIRLSWEYLLDDGLRGEKSLWMRWQRALNRPGIASKNNSTDSAPDHSALLHRALEIAYQKPLAAALAQPCAASTGRTWAVQAVFCIDVRSEVFRRALESVSPDLQTMGFAGFFGLPISYTPLGTTATRPQLPGLLAPTLCVTETCGSDGKDAAMVKARQAGFAAKQGWQPFQRLPGSAFTLVESIGLGYLGKLL
ncbi:MAG: putative inorganic carbon transporter subunit DabA, partial [Polaromonas sp.]